MNVSVPLKLSMSVICPWPDIWPWCGTPDCNLICAFFGTRSAYTYDDKYEGIILKTETNESAEESEEKFCYSSQPVVPNSKQQLKQDEIIQDSQKNVSNTKECQLNNHKSTQIPEKVTQPETSKANSQVHPKILQSDTCTTNRERNLKGNHKAAQVSLKVLQSETLKANYEKEVKDIRKSAQNPSKISQPKIFTLKHGNDVKENHFQKIPIEHNSKKDEETTKDTIIIKKDKENFYILDDTTENDIVLHEHDSHHMIAQRTTFPALDNIFARKRIMPLKSFANKEVQAGTGLFETHNLACQTSFSRHVSSVIINPDSHTGDEFVPEAINGMQTERKIIANSNVQTSIVSNKSVGEILNLVNQIKEDSIAKPQETSNTIPELCETNEVGLDDYFKESVADIESEDSSIENDNDENLIERQNEENNEIKEDEFSNREPIVENSSYAISPTGNLENDTSKTQNSNEAIENDQSMVSKHQVIEDNAQEDINVKRLTMVTFAPTANYTSENDNILGDGSVQSIEADLYHGENNEDSIHLMEKWISVALCKQYPNPKDWEYIVDCDLSEKGLESVYSLSNFMPKLETISLNNNNLEYLHGLPSVLTTLKVASNKLTCMTDFRHLPNLQYLDISDNLIEDLNDLAGLGNLRELVACDNLIRSFNGVFCLKSLQRLTLKRNKFTAVDFTTCNLHLLENLDLSENDIEEINGLHSLKTLKSLDLEQNNIRLFNPSQIMNALVCLKIGRNQLVELNVKRMPNLRALVLDHNKLKEIKNSEMLARIATFSARNQKRDDKININFKHIRGVENLYLTGNPLTKLETMTEFFKLDLIELSKVGLKELPEKFYEMCPGVSYINLNYNYLTNIRPLRRLAHLKQLTVICNELSNYEMVLEVTKRLSTLKYCDLRCNPFTMKFYPSLESLLIAYESRRHIWDITETKKYQKEWDIRDKEFRENIPDDIFVKRNIYRFSIIRRCPHMIRLDGSNVEESERIEGEKWYRRLPVELPIIY